MLAAPTPAPALRAAIAGLARQTKALLDELAARSPAQIRDLRLALEVGVIQRLAEDLTARLMRRDPLAQRVHHQPLEALGVGLLGVGRTVAARVAARLSRAAGP